MDIARNEVVGSSTAARQGRQKLPDAPVVRRGHLNLRCTCGACQICQDNARWERVYNEKFADPTYYLPRTLRRASSLS